MTDSEKIQELEERIKLLENERKFIKYFEGKILDAARQWARLKTFCKSEAVDKMEFYLKSIQIEAINLLRQECSDANLG